MTIKFLHRLFDFNGDGKTTLNEVWLAQKIWEEVDQTKDTDPNQTIPYSNSCYNANSYTPSWIPEPAPGEPDNYDDQSDHETNPENGPLTLAEYKAQRNAIIFKDILCPLGATAIVLYFAGIIAWAALSLPTNGSAPELIVIFIFLGIAALLAFPAISFCKESLSESCCTLAELKNRYLLSLSPQQMEARRKRKIAITAGVAGLSIITLVVFVSVNIYKNKQLERTYYEAISLVEEGAYDEAKTLFESTAKNEYLDSWDYIYLCDALVSYEQNQILDAYQSISYVDLSNLSPEQEESLAQFKEKLNKEYEDVLVKQMELVEKAREERIRKGVPFVGMPESEIANTSLGSPSSDIRHNTEMINGNCYYTNLYDFKIGSATIFIARCIEGKVTEVWDYRNNPEYPYVPKPSKKSETDDDPYNAKDYSDEEDFYDDHYDDFYDYYDAEEYYRDHH